MALLECKDLEINYDQVRAVKKVNLSLEEGETITLKAITGLKKPTSGEVLFNGESLNGMSPSKIVEKGIAMTPEGRRVFPYMSVKDNLLMGAFTRKDKDGIKEDLEKVLDKFPRLKERFKQQASTMSGGEQQMMVIGRALMSRPKILLMDEPSLGIAPKLVQDIARSIVQINKEDKVSVILVEQNSRMALKISNRAYAMQLGEVLLSGQSKDLIHDERIIELYLGGSH
jgi:branched-chain amino acid transport system ATP-binding protein